MMMPGAAGGLAGDDMVLRNRASSLAANGICAHTSRSYRAARAIELAEVLRNRAKLSYCYLLYILYITLSYCYILVA